MTNRTATPPSSIFWLLLLAGISALGLGIYIHAPLGIVLWGLVFLGAIVEPYPKLTGPKNNHGRPTPAGHNESDNYARYLWLTTAHTRLWLPSLDWVNITRLSWWSALGCAIAVSTAIIDPHNDIFTIDIRPWWWLNPAGVWLTIIGLTSSYRVSYHQSRHTSQPHPGVTLNKNTPPTALIIGATTGTVAGVGSWWLLTHWGEAYTSNPIIAGVGIGITVTALTMWGISAPTLLASYRNALEASERWHSAFRTLLPKNDVTVINHNQWGDLTVDTIQIDPSGRAVDVIKKQPQLASYTNGTVVAYSAPLTDSDGNPQWGTVSPTTAYLAVFPPTYHFDIDSPHTDLTYVHHAIDIALAQSLDTWRQGRVDEYQRKTAGPITPLHTDEATHATWMCAVTQNSDGADAVGDVRNFFTETMRPILDCDILADPDTLHAIIVGAIKNNENLDLQHPAITQLATSLNITPTTTILADYDQRLTDIDTWKRRFGQIKKVATKPPEPQWGVQQTAVYQHVTLTSLPFVTMQGSAPETFMGIEADLAATLQGAPFVSITYYPDQRRGTRHSQAFVVTWANGLLPTSPQKLTPDTKPGARSTIMTAATTASFPEHWILASLVNKAFDANKLDRPDLLEARPLTVPGARTALWKLTLHLYGSTTIGDIRKKLPNMKTLWGVDWVGVMPGVNQRDVILCTGADFDRIRLANSSDRAWLTDMRWQQAFYDSGVYAKTTGQLPATVSVTTLDHNPTMTRIIFRLPAGIALSDVKKLKQRLATASGNLFVQFDPDPDDGHNMCALVSRTDPLPDTAPYDFTLADQIHDKIVIGTGIDGEPVLWNPSIDPHMLFVGLTGSGKSSAIQAMLYGVLANGWDVAVADPVKGAADFRPFQRWTSAFIGERGATGIARTRAMLYAVYEEVTRRVGLNSDHSVGSFTDLPDHIRPNRLVVFVDEFNSVINIVTPQKPPPGASTDVMSAYASKLAQSAIVADIGKLVADIAAQARSAGVSLVLIGQSLKRADLEKLPGGVGLRNNLSRVLLGKATDGDRMAALRDPESAPDVGPVVPRGRGIFESVADRGKIVQVWYADPPAEMYPRELSQRRTGKPWVLDIPEPDDGYAPKFEGQVVAVEGAPVVDDLGETSMDWSAFSFESEPVSLDESKSKAEPVSKTGSSLPAWFDTSPVIPEPEADPIPLSDAVLEMVDFFDTLPPARTDPSHH